MSVNEKSKFWSAVGSIIEVLLIFFAVLGFFTEHYEQAACALLLLVLHRQEKGHDL